MKVVEQRDGSKMTHEFEEMTPEKRPQDPFGNGTGLVFETLEHGGEYPDTMPQARVRSQRCVVPDGESACRFTYF